jgi:hypothetical protein
VKVLLDECVDWRLARGCFQSPDRAAMSAFVTLRIDTCDSDQEKTKTAEDTNEQARLALVATTQEQIPGRGPLFSTI